nr:MAG TPA: hypothetical protein [Caudoviricetes sp.]
MRQKRAEFSVTKRTAPNWAFPENRHPQFWGDVSSFRPMSGIFRHEKDSPKLGFPRKQTSPILGRCIQF